MNTIQTATLALATAALTAHGSVLLVTGNDTLVGNRPSNLIANGSFEADAGLFPNYSYWATGTTLSPTISLNSWTASGSVAS